MNADFKAAHHNLIDPLNEPDPSDDTGLNSHFRSTFAPAVPSSTTPQPVSTKPSPASQVRKQPTGNSTNPFRKSSVSSKDSTTAHGRQVSNSNRHAYPSPPNSASPRQERFPSHREDAFGSYSQGRPRARTSADQQQPKSPKAVSGLTRGNSLRERYPGDRSVHPLDQIKRETKLANRSPHLRKKHIPGADSIDRLDDISGSYHHEGPFDASLLARNTSFESSPVAAVIASNIEALKATPRENIQDAIERHRPLHGTAVVPPGMPDRFGRLYDYEEGTDLMIEEGNYKRWTGVDYLPEDLKGKGEPSYSIERALKEHKLYSDKRKDEHDGAIEMTTHRRNKSLGNGGTAPVGAETGEHSASASTSGQQRYADWEGDIGRSNSTGRRISDGWKRRMGGLRRRRD